MIEKDYDYEEADEGLPPFVRGSQTSKEAAKAIRPSAGTLSYIVLAFLFKRGEKGATDEEMQLSLRMNPSSQRPRRVELVQGRRVEDSGRVRRTRSGRKAVVWRMRG